MVGVVNFVLDTRFEGLKADIHGGVSGHNDLGSQSASLAYGGGFAGGRGHIILSADYNQQDGLNAKDDTHRDWFESQPGRIPNPVVGALPKNLIIEDIRYATTTFGGLITSGPLKGTQFLPGGITAPMKYGPIVGSTFMSGGDGAKVNIGFAPDQERYSFFGHGEYDLTDALKFYGEASYAKAHVAEGLYRVSNVGAGSQFVIFRENPFLRRPSCRR